MSTSSSSSERIITEAELAQHNNEKSLWLSINGYVYDVTKFQKFHPGGQAMLLMLAGKECSKEFYALHNKEVLEKYKKFKIGKMENHGELNKVDDSEPLVSAVPYGEMPLLREGWYQYPWFEEKHRLFLEELRTFLREEVVEETIECDEMGEGFSPELKKKIADTGLLFVLNGLETMPLAEKLGITFFGGVKPSEIDYWHEMIANDTCAREIPFAFRDGIMMSMQISLPAMLQFGTKEVVHPMALECLQGRKHSALAISEPQAGSDVANVVTWGEKTPDGKHYIVSGVKKWITGGLFADYFVTAVRTGKPGSGMKGISLMVIERGEGVQTKWIPTSYSKSAGTALVLLDKVKVPVENILGKENKGFKCIVANFNHERFMICAGCQAGMRRIVQECFVWAMTREVFGMKLIKQPVIRFKLAKMVAAVESNQAFLESVTYQMQKCHENDNEFGMMRLGGITALLKYQTTRDMTMISDESCQIFGGRALTKTGMGRSIEYMQRCFKFAAILGGSEEIMADLGVRQSMMEFPPTARL